MNDDAIVRELRQKALVLRHHILSMVGVGRAGHLGGSASIVEIVTALYFHAMRGEIERIKSVDGMLQGHPDILTPGIEAATGSLGQGLSIGLGFALAARIDGLPRRTYVVLGDGEMAEGQVWEAAMAASRFKASGLIAFLDLNGVQATGPTREVFDIPCLAARWQAFGWNAQEIDGSLPPAAAMTSSGARSAHRLRT